MAKEKTVEAPAIEVPADDKAGEVVERWFIDTFHNRGIGGPEYNRLRAAAEDLKARLAALAK